MTESNPWVLPFAAVGAADLPRVGGKGANLGEMTAAGLPVPGGFCVTTTAFDRVVADDPTFDRLLADVTALDADDLDGVRRTGAALRAHLQQRTVPPAIGEAICAAWSAVGEQFAYAVRSSATAEDLPTASFAGQQDTYLNVRGRDALLDRVRACWASLYTDRAILYRRRNGIAHRQVKLSVVVQRMVHPTVSGILFTADPVTGHRGHTSIDAGFGLGEALVSGLIDADLFRVESATGRILDEKIGDKKLAIVPLPDGGTETVDLPVEQRTRPSVTAEQVAELTRLGQRIQAHYGRPQDIEWCIADGALFVVQSRPITSLFPPLTPTPAPVGPRVFMSIGHYQVMTAAMSPLAADLVRYATPIGRPRDAVVPAAGVFIAGGRLFADLAPLLRRAPVRRLVLGALGHIEPRARAVVAELVERPGFADGPRVRIRSLLREGRPKLANVLGVVLWRNPERHRRRLVAFLDRHVDGLVSSIDRAAPGRPRLEAALTAVSGLLGPMLDRLPPAIVVGLASARLLGRLAGPEHAADVDAIERGLVGNVTTEMDLAVGDLADLARAAPAVAEALRAGRFDALASTPGSAPFRAALAAFLDRFGCRGPSELDISRPRWRHDPSSVLQAVAGALAHGEDGAHRAHHAALVAASEAAGERLVDACARGLLGPLRRWIARGMLRRQRAYAALREHPKLAIMRVFDRVRDAIIERGEALVADGRLDDLESVWMLTVDELLAPPPDVRQRVAERREAHAHHVTLRPPVVMTETGEAPVPRLEGHADAPPGALVGSAVSAGVVEGVARVVHDPHTETLHKGEILVAPFTDPGWTPLFINASALVMEVGGRVTHGSVVAREYGLPAVVGIADATVRLRTGMRLRVDGDRGWVEILAEPEELSDDVEAVA